jgi:hypothetical protein
VEGQLPMVNGQWSMVNGQWSMVNGQWSMTADPIHCRAHASAVGKQQLTIVN